GMSMIGSEEVKQVHHWTESLFSFVTTRHSAFRFRSGQFTMLGLDGPQRSILRAYSIASAPYEDRLEFFSITVPQGALTSRLQHLAVGGLRHGRTQGHGDACWTAFSPENGSTCSGPERVSRPSSRSSRTPKPMSGSRRFSSFMVAAKPRSSPMATAST